MPLKFSTGRDSRLKHPTGAEPSVVAKARRGHRRPRYSTGESASIAHFTGRETDYRTFTRDSEVPQDKAKESPAMPRGR